MLKQLLQQAKTAPTQPPAGDLKGLRKTSSREVAVIGIALRLPQADTTDRFWAILRDGVDCMRHLPEGRLLDLKRYMALSQTPFDEWAVRAGEAAFLEEVDKFDYNFFRLSPKEAALMDPSQRLFLQTAWAAIEDAGYGGGRLRGSRTGIYVGFSSESVYKRMVAAVNEADLSMALTGNLNSMLPSRIAYLLDLHGPSLVIDTSCSSSLMALHLACQAIRNGECDQALAGGVQVHLVPVRQTKVGIESSSHRTRTFDDASDGTGTGEGVAAVLLKPLHKALRDGDHIWAVIKGSAANQDGHSIGLTAPNAAAQADVLLRAWRDADIEPSTLGYLEAHGTGTKLGDPIEIDGIRRAFSSVTKRIQFCAIGSVKSNMGHLDNAAGIAGLIKAVLVLKHRELPPSLHLQRPNRQIAFEESPVYINDRRQEWEPEGPRRCGVSSFGLSGTNCHVVLEEAPPSEPSTVLTGGPYLFTLSARTLSVLSQSAREVFGHLERHSEIDVAALCYTLQTGRDHWEHRLAFVAGSREELLEKLGAACLHPDATAGVFYGHCQPELPSAPESVDNARLAEACARYVAGAALDWDRLHLGAGRHRVSLPTYPFERTRCWLEFPGVEEPFHYQMRSEAAKSPEPERALGLTLPLHDGGVQAPLSVQDRPKPSAGKRKHARLKGRQGAEYTELEGFVGSVWREVLGFEELGVNDNFFEIGGDSISMTRVFALLEERFPVLVSIADLFAYPTIGQVAEQIAARSARAEAAPEQDLRQSILQLLTGLEQGELTLEEAVKGYHELEGDA